MSLVKPDSLQILADISLKTSTGLDYRRTEILETPAAIAADPFRFAGRLPNSWWGRSEPRDPVSGRKLLELLDRVSKSPGYARDSKRARLRDGVETETPGAHHHVACDDESSEFLPKENQNLTEWIADLPRLIDTNRAVPEVFSMPSARFVDDWQHKIRPA